MCCLNNNFCYLNNITYISTTLFHPHVFSQHLNNVSRTTLPNSPYSSQSSFYLPSSTSMKDEEPLPGKPIIWEQYSVQQSDLPKKKKKPLAVVQCTTDFSTRFVGIRDIKQWLSGECSSKLKQKFL